MQSHLLLAVGAVFAVIATADRASAQECLLPWWLCSTPSTVEPDAQQNGTASRDEHRQRAASPTQSQDDRPALSKRSTRKVAGSPEQQDSQASPQPAQAATSKPKQHGTPLTAEEKDVLFREFLEWRNEQNLTR